MFFRPAILIASTLVALAVATPTPGGGSHEGSSPSGQCNTGPVQCCNSVQSASSEDAQKLLKGLNIVIEDLTVPVGITCSPISVIGVGSSSCNAQTVCCENNSYNSLISIGCVPIIINA